ncbi:conserved exported hypothetical protein [Enterobacterales bacterium 8AC]|nr:conserved exported hypothetical protein [Enterobacterales bacterium 8AC]
MPGKIVGGILLLAWSLQALQAQAGALFEMRGAIVATACDIDTASQYQTINMGTKTVEQLMQDSASTAQPFSLKLVNCVLAHRDNRALSHQLFQVTFSGREEGGHFGLEEPGRGVVLMLADRTGNTAKPGVPLPPQPMQPGETELHYRASLKPIGPSVQTGVYHALVRYHLDYY